MVKSELFSLIREDYQRYEKLEGRKSGICKKIGRTFFSESFSITFWFRICSYLHSKNNVLSWLIGKPLSLLYQMNGQRLGIELPIGTRVLGGGKVLSL